MRFAELRQECDLPLGLVEEVVYAQSTYRLQRSSQLTLLTDGVVEARNAGGELFGFERTAGIAKGLRGGEDVWSDDDITVLRLVRLA